MKTQDAVDESHDIEDDWALIVPGGVWSNIGDTDLKLHSVYSVPNTSRHGSPKQSGS